MNCYLHLKKEQRLPKSFKDVEKIIHLVKSCQSNFKTALANSRFRGNYQKKVYNLSLNVLKHYDYIQRIIDKVQLLEKEKLLRREIASILIYELIFGKGNLPGESKAVTTILAYKSNIMNVHQNFRSCGDDVTTVKVCNIPRYARVHTLVTSVPCVINDLKNYGYQQIFYKEDISEIEYMELVKNLEKGTFLVDFHFKEILVFVHNENLINLDIYQNGHIFLQDKSSYIPIHILNPRPGSAVLDACAAPGMKCVHIAAKMKNKGVLIACERNKGRFETLKKTLQFGKVKISKVFCKDFTSIDPTDQSYSSIDYILLDPSCSGSGMVNRMDKITDTEDSKTKERLMKLAGFQIILLKHALKFPSVKRVVYSTCSTTEEENEYVIHEALNAFSHAFKLVPAMPEWSFRGSENYEYGKLCLRTVPERHLTNGFFVAVFERLDSKKHDMDFKNLNNNDKSRNVNEVSITLSAKKGRKQMARNLEAKDMNKNSVICSSEQKHSFVACEKDMNTYSLLSKEYQNGHCGGIMGMSPADVNNYRNSFQSQTSTPDKSEHTGRSDNLLTSEFSLKQKSKQKNICEYHLDNLEGKKSASRDNLESLSTKHSLQNSKNVKKIASSTLPNIEAGETMEENIQETEKLSSKPLTFKDKSTNPGLKVNMPLDVTLSHKKKKKHFESKNIHLFSEKYKSNTENYVDSVLSEKKEKANEDKMLNYTNLINIQSEHCPQKGKDAFEIRNMKGERKKKHKHSKKFNSNKDSLESYDRAIYSLLENTKKLNIPQNQESDNSSRIPGISGKHKKQKMHSHGDSSYKDENIHQPLNSCAGYSPSVSIVFNTNEKKYP